MDEKVHTVTTLLGGAVGAGLVLIVLPCAALYFGLGQMGDMPAVGLPILAIFGIMMLFGSLSLISALFASLGLSDASQALALPEGSIRAAIALALIVLFAIISIMLYQSISKPYEITGLDAETKSLMVRDLANRVIAIVPTECRPPGATAIAPLQGCDPNDVLYSVHVRQPPGQESTDLAKQLLILIGTLMTSVTSFYFASRATSPRQALQPPAPNTNGASGAGHGGTGINDAAAGGDDEDHDGCDVAVLDATADQDLPPATGGVA